MGIVQRGINGGRNCLGGSLPGESCLKGKHAGGNCPEWNCRGTPKNNLGLLFFLVGTI